MTKRLDQYRFSRREIARHRCNDCGVNVIKVGDYCLLRSEIWNDTFGLGWDDNLCLACIEQRLGRKLRMRDFIAHPSVEGFARSAALTDRHGWWRAFARKGARKIGRRLRQLRERRGVTQAELAARLDVSVGSVQHWEHGRNPLTAVRIEQIAGALHIKAAALFNAAPRSVGNAKRG